MDIESLLRSLNARKARYVVIGATAFPVHGYARATLDVDLLIEATPDNAKRVRQALLDFGYDMTDVSEEELLEKKVLIRQYLLETDIHPFVAGGDFEGIWRRRVEGPDRGDAGGLRQPRRPDSDEGGGGPSERPRGSESAAAAPGEGWEGQLRSDLTEHVPRS